MAKLNAEREPMPGDASIPPGRPRRLVGMLGGQTSWQDCATAIRHLASPGRLIRGPAIAEYEKAFAEQIGVRFAYSFSSGRVALYGVLQALGIGSGDEVLLQVPTHVVVPNAIRYLGARPVYVDCRLGSYNMDLDAAERQIAPRTRALVLQHTFGNPADLDGAMELCRRHGLELIEDCVHSLGSEYDGRQVGSFGRAAFFSTEETKTISSTMGGMLVTDDPEVAARVEEFQQACVWPSASLIRRYIAKFVVYHTLMQPRIHPYSRRLYDRLGKWNPMPRPTVPGELRGEKPANYEQRLSNAQATLALGQLRRLDANLAHRRAVARIYDSIFRELCIETPEVLPKSDPALVRYPLPVAHREEARETARPLVALGTWFTSVLEQAVSPAFVGYEAGSCPRAEGLARRLVNLPTHQRVNARHARDIALAVAPFAVRSR